MLHWRREDKIYPDMKMTSDEPTAWTLTEKTTDSLMKNGRRRREKAWIQKVKSKIWITKRMQMNVNARMLKSKGFFLKTIKFKPFKKDKMTFLFYFCICNLPNICKWGCWSLKPERRSTFKTPWTSGTVFASNTRGVEQKDVLKWETRWKQN